MDTVRLISSGIWLVASGCLFASGFTFVVTLGDFATYFVISLIVWCLASLAVIISSLNG